MKSLLKAEFIQLRTTRTAMWWAIIVFGLTTLATIWLLEKDARAEICSLVKLIQIYHLDVWVLKLILVFSLVAVTSNYRHKVSVTEHLITPKIWPLMLTKIINFGVCGALIVLVQALIVAGFMAFWPGAIWAVGAEDFVILGLVILGGSLAAMLGVAVARLVRVQLAAVLGAVGFFVLFEPFLLLRNDYLLEESLLRKQLITFLPGQALSNLVRQENHSWVVSAAILAGWIVLIAGAAYLIRRKRD